MFFTILILSYSVPAVYIFLRIWRLFIPREHRLTFILVFVLLYSLFPLSRMVDGPAGRILENASYYLLPFWLNLFLLILLADLLLLINLVFKIIPRGRIRERSLRNKAFVTIITLSIIIVVAGIINFNTIRVTGYRIEVPKRSSAIDSLRIAFVSDFHLNESVPVRFVEKFVGEIMEIKPDVMLYGGDIADSNEADEKNMIFEGLLRQIKTNYCAYAVLGNHEHYRGHEDGSFFERAGIRLIRDSVVIIANSFFLAGRNDSHVAGRKEVSDMVTSVSDSLPLILLDHRPSEIDQVSKTRVDIQLSGHTHNGQLFPINLITKRVYTLSYGYRKINNTHFFVSSGIRLWGPPVRTTGKSEIMVIDVNFK